MTAEATAARPLDRIRVLDLSSVLMGPYATQILGSMGADVIKVEGPEGDVVRQIGPARHAGMGPVYLNSNRSKRSITLDLKHPEGKAALLRLARDCDVLFYNIRPQAMERLGLSYEALSAINPRLIYVGVFGYGQDGPHAARPAYDDLMQAGSTLAALFARSTGGAPQYVPAAIADRVTGLAAVNAVLAAVIERHSSGVGQRIDIPMFETMVGFVLSDHLGGLSFDPPLDAGGYARLLAGTRRPYPTRDGYVSALIYTDKQWHSFFRLLGRGAQLQADPRLASMGARLAHIEDIYAEVADEMRTRSTQEWLDALTEADIPCIQVHDLESIFHDPHLVAIDYFGSEQHPSEGALRTMREPSTWSRTQPSASRPAPRQGEHTLEILRGAGFDETQIQGLLECGAAIAAQEQE